jgi:hypothetical protein
MGGEALTSVLRYTFFLVLAHVKEAAIP